MISPAFIHNIQRWCAIYCSTKMHQYKVYEGTRFTFSPLMYECFTQPAKIRELKSIFIEWILLEEFPDFFQNYFLSQNCWLEDMRNIVSCQLNHQTFHPAFVLLITNTRKSIKDAFAALFRWISLFWIFNRIKILFEN